MFIEARELYKSYGSLNVLKGVNISVSHAEIVSIAGPSGAGKTTLLQILGTLDTADKGQVFINDQDISKLRGKQLASFRNRSIGFIFQFHHLLNEFTAKENILMPAWIAGTSTKEAEKKADELLGIVGLSDRAAHLPSELSGGEQQRVAIARALINQPDLVLADEPSGNLDTVNAKHLHELFFRLRQEYKQTFIIITHNPELAAMADRRFIMKDGMISQDHDPARSSR